MKFNFSKLFEANKNSNVGNESWQYQFLMHVLTTHTANAQNWKDTLGIDISELPRDLMIDLVVTANGREIPFEYFIAMLEKSYNEGIENQVKHFLKERCADIQEKMFKFERELDLMVDNVGNEDYVHKNFVLNHLRGLFPAAHQFMKKLFDKK